MAITKQMNIKNRTYYFYNDLIKIFDFDPSMLNLDTKILRHWYLLYWICYKKEEYKINSANPLFLLIHKIDGFIEEKRGNKYLNIAFTDNNDEILKKYKEVLSGIKSFMEKINNNKSGEYQKDYLKIKFNSDDKLPLNKQLRFLGVTIVTRSVFEEDGKYYPQAFLDDCLYEL